MFTLYLFKNDLFWEFHTSDDRNSDVLNILFHQNSWNSIFEVIQVFWVTKWCVASSQPTYDRRLWKPNPFWATTRHSSMTISPKVLFSSATHPFAECKKRCYLPKYSLSLVSSRQMDSFPTFLASKVKVNKSETLLLLSSHHHEIIVSDLDLDMGKNFTHTILGIVRPRRNAVPDWSTFKAKMLRCLHIYTLLKVKYYLCGQMQSPPICRLYSILVLQ